MFCIQSSHQNFYARNNTPSYSSLFSPLLCLVLWTFLREEFDNIFLVFSYFCFQQCENRKIHKNNGNARTQQRKGEREGKQIQNTVRLRMGRGKKKKKNNKTRYSFVFFLCSDFRAMKVLVKCLYMYICIFLRVHVGVYLARVCVCAAPVCMLCVLRMFRVLKPKCKQKRQQQKRKN